MVGPRQLATCKLHEVFLPAIAQHLKKLVLRDIAAPFRTATTDPQPQKNYGVNNSE